jgi:CheY-like chemotaxis protein
MTASSRTPPRDPGPINILLVEDNPADVRLTREAFSDAQLDAILHVVEDGMQALEFLRRRGRYARAPTPDLVLLDLNLPRKGGLEVLEEVKSDPHLLQIPVVVLTTSGRHSDIQQAYARRANCFINKPLDLEQFVGVVRTIERFWLSTVQLPVESEA